MQHIAAMEHYTIAQLQMIVAAKEKRDAQLRAAHQKFVSKHQEAGDWLDRKAEYNRKHYQAKMEKRRAELARRLDDKREDTDSD